jgi:PmbA protein
MSQDLKQLSLEAAKAFLLALAKSRATQLEVFAERSSSTSISAQNGEVDAFNVSRRVGIGLRVLHNGAWGYAHTENLSQTALERAFAMALEHADLVAPEEFAVIAAWPEPPHVGDLYGEGLSGVTVDRKVQAAIALETSAREADPRVVTVAYSGYQDGEHEVMVANTTGLDRSSKQNFASQYTYPLVAEAGQSKSKVAWDFSREFETLDPQRTALESVQKSLNLLGAKPAPSGTFPVVIEHECLAELLGTFSSLFNAKMVQEDKSPLAGKLGQQIASAHVTLHDDATRPGGFASRPFDAEGYPSQPITLIENGKLLAFLHNTETAARAGQNSTGHAGRYGYQTTLTVAPSNMYLEPGDVSVDALRKKVENGLFLTGVSGTHAGANPYTGEFSLEAEGFWIVAGKVIHPLEVFTVAGNILELLMGIEAVGNDLKFGPPNGLGAYGCPSVLVKGLAIGGK